MDFTLFVYNPQGECICQELIVRPTKEEAEEEGEAIVDNQYPGSEYEVLPNAIH